MRARREAPSVVERLLAKVEHYGEHWLWQGTAPGNEPQLRVTCAPFVYVVANVRRAVWMLTHGTPAIEGEMIARLCDEPHCVAPAHLGCVDSSDITRLKVQRGTTNRGERSGKAKLTEEKVRVLREMLRRGHTTTEVARVFGVSSCQVTIAGSGKSWRDVPGALSREERRTLAVANLRRAGARRRGVTRKAR